MLRYRVPSGCAHSAFYAYTYNAPLPVTLVDYRAFCRPEGVELSWLVAAERDMVAYRVERQVPGQDKRELVGELPSQDEG